MPGTSKQQAHGRLLAWGAVAAAAYSALQLLVNGVVIDETVVPAQIIAGLVVYPAGHPHAVYYNSAFSLPHFLQAAALAVGAGVTAVSAWRNVAFLFLSAFVPYAVAVLLTRCAVWGFAAALLTLSESVHRFGGLYPLWVFPTHYSNGHIGVQLALLMVVLLLGRFWFLGGLLLGLMPGLHAGLALPAWAWAVVYVVVGVDWRDAPGGRKRLAVGWLGGVAVCALLAGFILVLRPSGVAAGPPYDVTADGAAIYRQFMLTSDVHRQPFPILSLGYLVTPVAFFAVSALIWRQVRRPDAGEDDRLRPTVLWLSGFAAMTWGIMYAVLAAQQTGVLPPVVAMLMPYRMSNFTALLLTPLAIAAMVIRVRSVSPRQYAIVLAVFGVFVALAAACMVYEAASPASLSRGRYSDQLVVLLLAVCFATYLFAAWSEGTSLWPALAGAGAVGAALASVPATRMDLTYFAALLAVLTACLLANTLADWSASGTRWTHPAFYSLIGVACLAGAAAALPNRHLRWGKERWDKLTPFDRELSAWLDEHAEPQELILPPLNPRTELQAKTGHPVLMEPETLYLMSYLPSLAGVIGHMSADLYGLDYAARARQPGPTERINLGDAALLEPWTRRSLSEWQTLADTYHFRLVLAPTERHVDLPAVFESHNWTLHTIPPRDAPRRHQ